MKPKEKQLIVTFLDEMSQEYADHGCNDWSFPEDWTQEERETFVREYHEWNGDPEEFNPKRLHLPDFAVMSFLSDKLARS